MEPSFGGSPLIVHPDTPARAIEGVVFTYVWQGPAGWRFDFIVNGPPAALKLPAPVAPSRADGLWHRTCFEVFLMDPTNGSYIEFNLSPSGQWAAYRFDRYRTGMRELDLARSPQIFTTDPAQMAVAWRERARALGLEEDSPLMQFPALPNSQRPPTQFALFAHCEDTGLRNETAWRMAASAVVEEADGTKSYWALAHPPGKPDFHHEAGFVLELPPSMEKIQ